MIKRMIVGVVILFAILLLMLPKTDDASKKKMASAAMLMCTNDFRTLVAEQVRLDNDVDLVFDNKCPALITTVMVDEDLTITIRSAKNDLTMVLTPMVENKQVHWSCRGEPAEFITSICKPYQAPNNRGNNND